MYNENTDLSTAIIKQLIALNEFQIHLQRCQTS